MDGEGQPDRSNREESAEQQTRPRPPSSTSSAGDDRPTGGSASSFCSPAVHEASSIFLQVRVWPSSASLLFRSCHSRFCVVLTSCCTISPVVRVVSCLVSVRYRHVHASDLSSSLARHRSRGLLIRNLVAIEPRYSDKKTIIIGNATGAEPCTEQERTACAQLTSALASASSGAIMPITAD